jgi:hypothetical protein
MSKTKILLSVFILLIIYVSLIAIGFPKEKSNPDFVDPTAHPELVDQSWLTGKPCALPCWQGLEPGKSTRDDVLKTLPNLSFLDSEKGISISNGRDFVDCMQPSNHSCLIMEYKKESLDRIFLLPNYVITLDEVVAQLGVPDFLEVNPMVNERRDSSFSVFWLNKQLMLTNGYIGKGYLPFQNTICDQILESGGKVPKGVEIQRVNILSPELLDEYTKYIYKDHQDIQWNGFSE